MKGKEQTYFAMIQQIERKVAAIAEEDTKQNADNENILAASAEVLFRRVEGLAVLGLTIVLSSTMYLKRLFVRG